MGEVQYGVEQAKGLLQNPCPCALAGENADRNKFEVRLKPTQCNHLYLLKY